MNFSYLDSPDLVGWSEVKGLFKEYGGVWVNCPEMRWYEESWGALMKGYLADPYELDDRHRKGLAYPVTKPADSLEGEVIVKLRAICLLMMYFGFCKACFDEHCYPPPLEDMFDELQIDPVALANLAGMRMLAINIPDGDSFSFCEMERFMEDGMWDLIKDEVWGLVWREGRPVYDCLEGHYEGKDSLFVALWNSRRPLWAIEKIDSISATPETLEGLEYVHNGMGAWW